MSNINFSDLELLSNRKKLSKYFDKEKLSQNIQIEQIIGQINNISKNDQEMPLNLNLNESLKNNLEVLINTYYKINEEVKDIKITSGRFFIETLVDEILADAISKADSVNCKNSDKVKVINIESKSK